MALFPMLLLLMLSIWRSMCQEFQCAVPRTSVLSFSVISRRNQTGHRTAQVLLTNNAQTEVETGTLEINIDQNTTVCNGVASVNIMATVTAPPPRPGSDYRLFPGLGYYKLHTTPRTWLEAETTCEFEGGHLAIVNSKKEEQILKMIYEETPTIQGSNNHDMAFLGSHDKYIEGQFITIFGDPLNETGYWNWASGHPTKNTNHNCAIFLKTDAKHYDRPCGWKLGAFCEQELY